MQGELDHSAPTTWWIGPALLGWIMVAAAMVVSVGNTYLVDAISSDLNLSTDEFTDVQTIKALASVLVVFIAGQIPSWLGYRTSVFITVGLLTFGSLVIAASVSFVMLSVGYALLGAAYGSIAVLAISMINAYVVDKRQRASAFAFLGAMGPAVYLIFPLLTGFVVDNGNWRLVPLGWAAIGIVMFLCLKLAPSRSASADLGRPEIATGVLAGIMLAFALGALGSIDWSDLLNPKIIIQVLGAILAGALLVVAYRRSSSPGLSLAPLKDYETRMLLLVAALVSITNIYFWITVGFQYVYHLSLTSTSIALLPLQAVGIFGTVVVARYVMRRFSVYVAGLIALALQGVGLCFLFGIQPDQPVWVPSVLVAIFGLFNAAFGATIASVIMSGATPAGSGSMSAYKSAAGSVGGLLGTIFVSAFTLCVIQSDFMLKLVSAGVDDADVTKIVSEIVEAPSSVDQLNIYSTYSASYPVEILHQESLIAGFRANIAVGLLGTLVAALIIWRLKRHQMRTQENPAAHGNRTSHTE
jgi:predicted MFS family arabinose efflux permease